MRKHQSSGRIKEMHLKPFILLLMSLWPINQDGSGNREVIAAGNYYSPYDKVEKYNFQEDTWTFSNDLPFGLWGADSVPYGDSFVLVGGYIEPNDVESDAILLYKPMDDSWDVMEGALKTPKRYVKAINVRRNMFPEC